MKTLDMGVGNPEFMFPFWNRIGDDEVLISMYPDRYMDSVHDEDLEGHIRTLHKTVGNINPDGYHLVIGNGATQLLAAAMRALDGGKTKIYHCESIQTYAKPPYFSRFPYVSGSIGTGFTSWANDDYDIEIQTVPNNPDGQVYEPICKKVIVDACYNWPQYMSGFTYDLTGSPIVLFSLAKATGHAATRIGWALVKDKKIADKMNHFVEITTMGVSNVSQQIARYVIWEAMENQHSGRNSVSDLFTYATDELNYRWKKLNEIKDCLPFKILNDRGMFVYAEGKCPEGLTHVEGIDMGEDENKFRLNIGCNEKTFEEFIRRMTNGREETGSK